MKSKFLLLLILSLVTIYTKAQNIAVNQTGNLPDTSAMLDVSSTNKGFLAPRMTTAQQNAIPLPANGLLIFNTTDNGFKVNTGTTVSPVWTALTTGNAGIGLTALSAITPLSYNNTTGAFSIAQAATAANGFLSSSDWNTFNGKQTALSGTGYAKFAGSAVSYVSSIPNTDLANSAITIQGASTSLGGTVNIINGTGFVKATGSTISYDNSTYLSSATAATTYEPILTSPNTALRYLNGYKKFVAFNTDSVTEGATNLYFTNARARSAVSLTNIGTSGAATYNSSTGVLNIPAYATSSGTVTSVGLTSSDITVGGSSPITTSGTYTLTLPTVNSNVGSFTNANITVNAKGLVTAVSNGSGGSGSGWSLTGNSGTSAGTNFVGTTDGQGLTFKVNSLTAGFLGLSGSSFAVSYGVGSSAGFKSTAIGASANANTSNEAIALGFSSNAAGFKSIAIGSGAQTSSSQNETIAIGTSSQATYYQGIAIGSSSQAGNNGSTIAIGVSSNATGYQSTAIGSNTVASAQNSTAIGNGASVSTANYISIGNTSVTAIRGQVNFTTYSDGRFKRNINANVPGLDFVLKLRPVTYNWDIHKFNSHSRGNDYEAIPAKYTNEMEEAAIVKKESITYTGFIAQEVEKAAVDCQFNFSGVLKPQNEKDAYSLSYAEFVVPLVKSVQELHKETELLSNKLYEQQKIIDQLLLEIHALKEKK